MLFYMVVGCFGQVRFSHGHTPLEILAKENIQGISYFLQAYIIWFNVKFVNVNIDNLKVFKNHICHIWSVLIM